MLYRHDTITLLPGVKEADFEQFMTEDLLPYFSEKYRGPTRSSRADIKSQSLLKTADRDRQYLWVTGWDGSAGDVGDPEFERVRMTPVAATAEMLRKLDAFGKRSSLHVLAERASVAVATNV
jgi:hypothetical protein